MRSLIGKQAPKFDATAVINGYESFRTFRWISIKGKNT